MRKEMLFAVNKGGLDDPRAAVKNNAIRTVLMFMEHFGCRLAEGRNTFILQCPDVAGDGIWVRDNVFRYADIFSAQDVESCKAVAERAASLCREKGGEKAVGYAAVKYYLDDMYMSYDMTEWS